METSPTRRILKILRRSQKDDKSLPSIHVLKEVWKGESKRQYLLAEEDKPLPNIHILKEAWKRELKEWLAKYY